MAINKLRHQTGTATLIQLIVMLLLNFVNSLASSITSCLHRDGCVENIVVNCLFILVLAVWLMFVAMLGYMAQTKRSRRFARALLACEALIAIVTLFNIRHYPNLLGLFTSIIDFGLAVWVITLAYRLSKAEPVAVRAAPAGHRPRKRVPTSPRK